MFTCSKKVLQRTQLRKVRSTLILQYRTLLQQLRWYYRIYVIPVVVHKLKLTYRIYAYTIFRSTVRYELYQCRTGTGITSRYLRTQIVRKKARIIFDAAEIIVQSNNFESTTVLKKSIHYAIRAKKKIMRIIYAYTNQRKYLTALLTIRTETEKSK